MNAFYKPMNLRPDIVKVIHGRKGQATEYVEYRPYNSTLRFAAQKSGDWFYVFEIEPGKNGSVRTLGSFPIPSSAVHQAHDLAYHIATSS